MKTKKKKAKNLHFELKFIVFEPLLALKVALNFSEGTASFEKISQSVKNVNVDGLTSGINKVTSAISNVAKIAGFRIISDEVHDAWQQVKNFTNELT